MSYEKEAKRLLFLRRMAVGDVVIVEPELGIGTKFAQQQNSYRQELWPVGLVQDSYCPRHIVSVFKLLPK